MLINEIKAAQSIWQWKDRLVMHPLPITAEAEKASFLQTLCDYEESHEASLPGKPFDMRSIRGLTLFTAVLCFEHPSVLRLIGRSPMSIRNTPSPSVMASTRLAELAKVGFHI